MKNLIIAIILIFAGLHLQAQRHTMYVTTISDQSTGVELATNVFNSFGERCVESFNDHFYTVEQGIYVFRPSAATIEIDDVDYEVVGTYIGDLSTQYHNIPEAGTWYGPTLQPITGSAVNNRWIVRGGNRIFNSQLRAIRADGWTINQAALDRAQFGTQNNGDVFFSKEVTVSTGETFRYTATVFHSTYGIQETRIDPPSTGSGGFFIIQNAHLNALMNCAISRW